MSYVVLMALALGQCQCGPRCACEQFGPCRCVAAIADVPPPLPSIDRGVAIADELRRPVVVWVGRRDVDAEAALPEAIHCYARAITEKEGCGVCYSTCPSQGVRQWLWRGGSGDCVAALRAELSSRPSSPASSVWLSGSSGYFGNCAAGQCAGGACAGGQCAGGACAGGRSGFGLFGRRR